MRLPTYHRSLSLLLITAAAARLLLLRGHVWSTFSLAQETANWRIAAAAGGDYSVLLARLRQLSLSIFCHHYKRLLLQQAAGLMPPPPPPPPPTDNGRRFSNDHVAKHMHLRRVIRRCFHCCRPLWMDSLETVDGLFYTKVWPPPPPAAACGRLGFLSVAVQRISSSFVPLLL
jgi:hypothetical protein